MKYEYIIGIFILTVIGFTIYKKRRIEKEEKETTNKHFKRKLCTNNFVKEEAKVNSQIFKYNNIKKIHKNKRKNKIILSGDILLDREKTQDKDKLISAYVKKGLNGHIDSSGERTRKLTREAEGILHSIENDESHEKLLESIRGKL